LDEGFYTADAILVTLRAATGGLAIRDFKAALGGGEETIRRRLHALEQAGAVRRTGRLAATRYHAM
jgi:DeoR/GlpR family transcriptional regulator of sugar metabolism